MSDTESNATSAGSSTARVRQGDYEVGYGKPPVGHRFKHGNKANPRGRRTGSRHRKLVIQEVLFEPVTVREGGETRRISALMAVLKKTLSKALAGDHKAGLTIIGIAQKEGLLTPEQEQAVEHLSDSDLAIMEDVKKRLGEPVPESSPDGRSRRDSGE